MANKKVSQLVSKPSVLVTDLFPIADPTTGQLFKTTISDLGTAIGSGVSSVNSLVGAVVLDTDDIQELVSPTNKWFTDTRARAALSASSPLTYNSGTGAFGIQVATGSQNGYLSSTDWTTFNAKQAALSGTGFVKISGTTISYDNSTYALDSVVVKLTGNQTIAGTKTFSGGIIANATDGNYFLKSEDIEFINQAIGNSIRIHGTTNSNLAYLYFGSNTSNNIFGFDGTKFIIDGSLDISVSLSASSIVKAGGTSSQFLKADGSVDSSTYLTTSSATSTYVPYIGANQHLNMGVNWGINSGQFLLITRDGANTLGNTSYFGITDTSFNNGVFFQLNTSNNIGIYGKTSGTGSAQVAYISRTGDIGANGFIKTGGTSSQFLKADGSVDTNSYLSLIGGTLTGALSGTSSSFTSTVSAGGFISNVSSNGFNIDLNKSAGFGALIQLKNTSSSSNELIRIINSSNTIISQIFPSASGISISTGSLSIGTISSTVSLEVLNTSASISNNPGNSQIRASASSTQWLSLGYDTTANAGYLQGAQSGISYRPIILNFLGTTTSPVLIGQSTSDGVTKLQVTGGIITDRYRINDTAGGYVTLEMENSTRWRINYLGRFGGYGAGTLTTDASGNISASSDRSLKDIIKPIENVLENIKDFEAVYFKWNDKTDLDKENVYMSTIAQSIQKHYPNAVGKMPDGTLTVQDRAVTAILVQAIKELTEKVKTLENK